MTNHEASIITELVAKVGELVGRIDESERQRGKLRAADDHWRERTERKIDEISERLDDTRNKLAELPGKIDQRICDEIEEHERDDERRMRSSRATLVVVAVSVVLAIAATMEFVDHKQVAGIVFLCLAAVSPFLIALFIRRH
jgi:gas vesicle protein